MRLERRQRASSPWQTPLADDSGSRKTTFASETVRSSVLVASLLLARRCDTTHISIPSRRWQVVFQLCLSPVFTGMFRRAVKSLAIDNWGTDTKIPLICITYHATGRWTCHSLDLDSDGSGDGQQTDHGPLVNEATVRLKRCQSVASPVNHWRRRSQWPLTTSILPFGNEYYQKASSLIRLFHDRFEARNKSLVGVHWSVRRIEVRVAACEMTTATHRARPLGTSRGHAGKLAHS